MWKPSPKTTEPTTCLLACTYCDTPLHQLEPTENTLIFSGDCSPVLFCCRFGIPSDLKQQYTVRKTRLNIPIRLYTVQAFLNSTIWTPKLILDCGIYKVERASVFCTGDAQEHVRFGVLVESQRTKQIGHIHMVIACWSNQSHVQSNHQNAEGRICVGEVFYPL